MTFFGWRLVRSGFSVWCAEKRDGFHEPCVYRRCVCWCHSSAAADFLAQIRVGP